MAARLQTQRDRLRPARASRPLHIVGIGVQLVGDAPQFAGEIGVAFRDAPQFDRCEAHKRDRAARRPPQTIVVRRHSSRLPTAIRGHSPRFLFYVWPEYEIPTERATTCVRAAS